MAVSKAIKKQSLTDNKWIQKFQKMFEKLKDLFPAPQKIFSKLKRMIEEIIPFLNTFFRIFILFLLIGQTVHILNNQQKRILNLRKLIMKWIIYIFLVEICGIFQSKSVHGQIFVLFCNIVALIMIYPSKVLKTLYLKYLTYNDKKKNQQIKEDELLYQDLTVFGRLLISFTLIFLSCVKYLVTFIHPNHRKNIQGSMKEVNLILVQEKYFWKIYDTQSKNIKREELNVQTKMRSSIYSNRNSYLDVPSEKQILKFRAQEVILISTSNMTGSKQKFSHYCFIQLHYHPQKNQIIIISEDGKQETYELSELILKDENIIGFIYAGEEQPSFIKFQSDSDKQKLLSSIPVD